MKASELHLTKIRVHFPSAPILDLEACIDRELEKIRDSVEPGMTIAITVGSRGICDMDRVVRRVVDDFKHLGARPFIVPAMGSHGGATAEGQARVLADYGITEEAMGVPVKSSMQVEKLGQLPENPDIQLYMDKNAYQADKVFVINRIKPHTDFHGPHESGIVKMLVIGLGKQAQALAVHDYQIPGLRDYIPAVAKAIIGTGRILGALALVEDGQDCLSVVECARPEDILETDQHLLRQARQLMASLPFTKCDVLVVDWMGKNISGTGLDTNIVGRLRIEGAPCEKGPEIARICVLNLTEQSHGNGLGVGIADVVTKRLADQINWDVTYENVLTSRFVERGFLPIVRKNDREAINTALFTCGHVTLETVRLARIRDTLHLEEIYVSDALLTDLKNKENVKILEQGLSFAFNDQGNLTL